MDTDGLMYLFNEELHDPALMNFPVPTVATILALESSDTHDREQVFPFAPAAAAALRAFAALLLHGSNATRSKITKHSRDLVRTHFHCFFD
jgi:hypothetical protein